MYSPTPYIQDGKSKLKRLTGNSQFGFISFKFIKIYNCVSLLDDATDPMKDPMLGSYMNICQIKWWI